MNKVIIILAIILNSVSGNGQGYHFSKLNIGDNVPNVKLRNVRNYPSKEVNISDFRGKLLILDFWAVNCGPCIAAFPHMQELQHQFGNKIQILLVTDNPIDQVDKLAERVAIVRETRLPFVLANEALYKLFPHTSEPYHVWIDEKGKVIVNTSGYNTTSETVSAYLKKKAINFSQRDDCTDWTDEKYRSLLQEGNGRQIRYVNSSSFLMNYLPCIKISSSGPITDSITGKIIGWKDINAQLKALYGEAYRGTCPEFGRLQSYPPDRIILDIPDAESYLQPRDSSKMDDWKKHAFFCYESRIPSVQHWKRSQDSLFMRLREIMREDLNLYLFKAVPEKRTLKCWILIKTEEVDNLKSKGGDNNAELTDKKVILRNLDLSTLVGFISTENESINTPPLLNETNVKYQVDMILNCSLRDIPSLKRELSKYGLDLIEAEREVNVLVLSQNSF